MRLLMHDTLATAPIAAPLAAAWIDPTPDLIVESRPALPAADVAADDAAFLPASEVGRLQRSHRVVSEIAVVADGGGPVSLRTPVRPDEVDQTPVLLQNVSGVAELLARATLQPYFGIRATSWTRDPEMPDVRATVVEGIDAVRPIADGFTEDLCRAWFILTGMPAVTHVLLTPVSLDREQVQSMLDTLRAAAALGQERRREWRNELIDRYDLDRESVLAVFAKQRLELTPPDREALLSLLQRGSRGSDYPFVRSISYLEATPAGDTGTEPG